jgi:hypothetical protein
MKKWIFGVLIGLGAAALGVGGAFAYNATAATTDTSAQAQVNQGFGPGQGRQNGPQGNGQGQQFGPMSGQQQGQDQDRSYGPWAGGGMMNFPSNQQQGQYQQTGPQYGGGMMDRPANNSSANTGERISLDDAYTKAEAYVATLGSNLKIAEIMEFQNNFYVVVTESDSGRGAMELIVDPYTGSVSREQGADMMWNLKYGGMGMMAAQTATDNTLTLDEARTAAQTALDESGKNAVLNDGGYSFYGYYTFDYSIDGQTTGMLSINGLTGQVLYHTWHGTFISEKEY